MATAMPMRSWLIFAIRKVFEVYSLRETLNYSLIVIASEARQSSALNKSTAYGSPRRSAPRDDEFFSVSLTRRELAPGMPRSGKQGVHVEHGISDLV